MKPSNMTKSEFQIERPIRNGNEITFMGKLIALIIPKDVPNLTSPGLSPLSTSTTINNKK